MTTEQALAEASYRASSIWEARHCSNCSAYVLTTKAGEGRCAAN